MSNLSASSATEVIGASNIGWRCKPKELMMKIADASVSATAPVRAALIPAGFRYTPPQKSKLRSGILVWGVCMALLIADAWMAAADARRARDALNGALIGAGIGALVDGREGARTGAVVGAITGAVQRPRRL